MKLSSPSPRAADPDSTDATPSNDASRVFDLLAHQLQRHPRPDAVAQKVDGQWQRFSTREILDAARALAAGMHAAGVGPGDRVATMAETNRVEWNIIDLALLQLGAVHVPIYPTLTPQECHFILEDSATKLLFVSGRALAARIAPIRDRLPTLERLYTYAAPANGGADPASWTGLRGLGESLLREKPATGQKLAALAAAVRPEDLATLIYTSGTTGQPKGVMLSHANLVSNALAVARLVDAQPTERALSFLPLCHIYERTMTNAYFYGGMPVYYAENLDKVGENLREVQPDFFSIVPRILEKTYERIIARGEALPKRQRKIFSWALALAERIDPEAPGGFSLTDRTRLAVADKLVFSKWRAALGGKVRGIVCGSAALNPKLARVFWNAGVKIYEGYGPTEASPVITTNDKRPGWHRIGTVGPVIAGGEVRLAEDGEILYRGPNVMLGYYRRPDLTAETVDAEGFLHTGDVGEFLVDHNSRQFLRITDRKKEIFKTSGGKYIAPQPAENRLKQSAFIAQAMVVGEYRKFPAALIVPDFPAVRAHLAAERPDGEPLPAAGESLAALPVVRTLIAAEIERINAGFAQYAKIKNFVLLGQEWTLESGELTFTQKLKRREILKKFAAEIESVYAAAER